MVPPKRKVKVVSPEEELLTCFCIVVTEINLFLRFYVPVFKEESEKKGSSVRCQESPVCREDL